MDYTLEQLKAMAYDRIISINTIQAELGQINRFIEEKSKQGDLPTETSEDEWITQV